MLAVNLGAPAQLLLRGVCPIPGGEWTFSLYGSAFAVWPWRVTPMESYPSSPGHCYGHRGQKAMRTSTVSYPYRL